MVTGNGESGTGNWEPGFGNKFTAVSRMRSQNGRKVKRKKSWELLYDHALFELDRRRGKIMNSECKTFSQDFHRNVDFIDLVFL